MSGFANLTTRAGFGLALSFLLTAPARAAELPENFRLEPVVGGLTEPSALAIAGDVIFIGERSTGDVRALRDGRLQATPICHVDVETSGDAGLLGVAIHPRYQTNGWIYLYYTDSTSQLNKVTRYAVVGTACGDPTDIVADLGAGPSLLRNGGGIAFGPDGKLYVATGDMGDPGNGQDDTVLQGKVLRLEDDGSTPSDNPNTNDPVYALGLRDGRAIVVEPGGQVYAYDGGDASDVTVDELNATPPGGNLGWDLFNGDSGGIYDDPLTIFPASGGGGLTVYGAKAFPDLADDMEDSDEDRFGSDFLPGVARSDDDGNGVCIGSVNAELACTSDTDCPDRPSENAYCYMDDDVAEYCPGGTPIGDDDCNGVDEPDESYLGNLFVVHTGTDRVMRGVIQASAPGVLDQMQTFLDNTALADCPTGWSAVGAGDDGQLYLTARNGGGSAGALYRVVYDGAPGPREVSAPGSAFPLTVGKGGVPDEVVVFWEDLRKDAMQPRDDGTNPLPPEREYTVWMGDLGDFTSHVPVSGLEATPGTAVHDALRTETFDAGSGDKYFLASGRGDNLEGSLGTDGAGVERTGYTQTDLCPTFGFHDGDIANPFSGWPLFTCGRDFTLLDELGEEYSLSDLRGKVVSFDYSGVWCGPCISQANVMEPLHQIYRDRGVQFLTVLMDEDSQSVDWIGRPSWSECREWGDRPAGSGDHTFPCWADPEDASGRQASWDLYNRWGAIPTNIIIDTGGRVIYNQSGFSQTTILDLIQDMIGVTDSCLQ